MNRFTFIILNIFLLTWIGCSKVDTADYNPEFAIPIIKDASVSFTELWQNDDPNQSLIVQSDGSLVFRYESEEVKLTTKSILGELTFPIIAPLADTLSVLPFSLPANIIMEEAFLSGGVLVFQFQPIGEVVEEVIFTLPQITLNGQPLVITTDGFSGITSPVDLTGYTFRPKNNELEIKYSANDSIGNSVILQNAGVIAKPTISFLKGTWGREEFQLAPTKIAIDLYDERFLNGNIRFSKPTITAKIESSFGVPIRSRIDILNASTKRGDNMVIDATAIDGVDINYPLLTERGESKTTVLQLDYTNSNIVDVFDAQLTELEYGLTAIANPDNNTVLTSFVEDSSTFKAQVVVEVPVVGRTKKFIVTENFDVPFEDIKDVAEGEFKLITENELPLSAQLQFYFLGNDNFVVDSLFQNSSQIIEAAPIDKEGNVSSIIQTTTFIPFSAVQMKNIVNAEQLQVRAVFKTTESERRDVIIRADQSINFKMGLKFKVN